MRELKLSFEEKISMIIESISYYEEEYKTAFTRDNLGGNVNFLLNEDKNKIRNEIFNLMIEMFDYDKLPNILSDEDYFNLKPYNIDFETELPSGELWTASKDFFHNYNLVASRKYYKGIYKFSNGIYSTPEKENAIKYADYVKKNSLYFEQDINLKNEEFSKLDYTIAFKIPNAKVIKDTDLLYIITSIFYDNKVVNKDNAKEKQLLKYVSNLYNDDLKFKLAFLFENDLAKMAILLGYDAVYITKDYEFYFQVLNRSKVCISYPTYQKSEYQLVFRDTDFK
ncbi:MAG: hypothetical protein IJX17_02440 [Clostridia bacterium]|nr:hypothetical protein [Clostridia bacterium]